VKLKKNGSPIILLTILSSSKRWNPICTKKNSW